MQDKVLLGIDIGSVSVNSVVMNGQGAILEDSYTRTQGQPVETVLRVLKKIILKYPVDHIEGVALTGTGGKLMAELLGGTFVNEVIAQARGISHIHPEVRTVIEMGGADSKLICLRPEGESAAIYDFATNSMCAAGTGSFLDQQANRLDIAIEDEFGRLALMSKKPPRIAGRCSVFAKSDMIHLQQVGTPDYDIVAGLCHAVARNFKSTVAKGKPVVKPIAFQGGVAANRGMVKAFEEVLDLEEGELLVPQHHASLGAIGAVLVAQEREAFPPFRGTMEVEEYQKNKRPVGKRLKPLIDRGDRWSVPPKPTLGDGKIKAFLGIDVGSLSTNLVVIDEGKRVLARRYLMTAGRPLEAIRRGLAEIGAEVGDIVEILGVGTTGSGRYLTGDFVGADLVKNEITSQARAAIDIDPDVDTIFEIGGQDSKYVSLDHGTVVDFEMNKVCAAGTGSFLEEQAERLNIKIVEEFGSLALSSRAPVSCGERCTVFMESDLMSHQQAGAQREDLVAGLAYSIVHNYLNKVVGDRRVGERIFFQGGVAWNRGVVAAFEHVLGKTITVPPHHDVTGAIGVAILAMENYGGEASHFKGFDLSRRNYETTSFECKGCPNRCTINRVAVDGELPLLYGGRCERYERRKDLREDIPDLFAERERRLLDFLPEESGRPRVGLPWALYVHELLPLWATFFDELGFDVVLSDRTNNQIIHRGLDAVAAEACYPIKVAHGHVIDLVEKGVDYIFLPSIIDMWSSSPGWERSYNCPYVQAIPYLVRSAIETAGVELLSPPLHLRLEEKRVFKELIPMGRKLGKSPREVRRAHRQAVRAQQRFYASLSERGKEVLETLRDRSIVLVSRPYNGCDSGVNLDIPKKLRELGVLAIPMDFLPIDSIDLSHEFPSMYWRYGQRIFAAAEIIAQNPRLYALYITNFGCGPDSFITHFFRGMMGIKPYLQIEVDEHSADAGVITRCEAFLDSLGGEVAVTTPTRRRRRDSSDGKDRTLYIPYMCDHAFALEAAFQACGVRAQVLPEPNEETVAWGRRYTLGKECYPCLITVGDLVKLIRRPDFVPEKSALFMPSALGPCRFGQYHQLHRAILDRHGLEEVPILSPDSKNAYGQFEGVNGQFRRLAWRGFVAVDLLERLYHEARPYATNPEEADQVYRQCLDRLSRTIVNRGDICRAIQECVDEFEGLEVDRSQRKPVIGVVGEIFIRSNRFSNNQVVRKIEDLGGEVSVASFAEWIYYTNFMSRYQSRIEGRPMELLKARIQKVVQRHDERRLAGPLREHLTEWLEPPTEELIAKASPYLHHSLGGEAILTVGKALDYAHHGLSGIVNVMPLTCMPGTVVTALSRRLREDLAGLPWLNLAYDGLEQGHHLTRLEAFMYQARHYMSRRKEHEGT